MNDFTQLGDRYDIGQVIGRGGMAEVYEGTDLRLNRKVAIKVLRADLARDPMFQERFRREAQSAAGLNHPNIVAIYDTGEDLIGDGSSQVNVPYIVMEFVDGVTLRQMLNNGPRILPERGLEITAGVLAALDYAHRHGIVHRDIKPANVMINSHGDAKVMDFGIARAMSDAATSVTATSAVMGTAQYLSPEQARGELVDARSDIYSAGCVLYELLTGTPPFNGESPVSIAYQHVNELPSAPSTIDPSIAATLDAITLHALAKQPSNRYQSAAEMRADVERAIAGMPIMARMPISSEPMETQAIPVIGGTSAIPIIASAATKTISAGSTKSGPSIGKWIATFLAAVGAAGLIYIFGNQFFSTAPATVAVPNLKGKTVAEATTSLTAIGLVLGQETPQPDDNAPKGTVIAQDPVTGEQMEAGQAVNITTSAGKEQVSVPDLKDLTTSDDARLALTDARLVLGRVTPIDSDKPEGTVLDQDPKANTVVDIGTLVSITVSNGKVAIPKVVGKLLSQAKNDLLNAGFEVDVVMKEDGTVPINTVISQSPKAKTVAAKGTVVTLVVAKTPADITCPDGSTIPWDAVCPTAP